MIFRKTTIVILIIILASLISTGVYLFLNSQKTVSEPFSQKKASINLEESSQKDLKVPSQELLLDYIAADTNTDNEIETLVVTENPLKKKAHFYILDSGGQKLYDKDDALVAPDFLELRFFGDDSYYSYFLVFGAQERGLFIRWDGTNYTLVGEEKEIDEKKRL